jgi:hypothetical protein
MDDITSNVKQANIDDIDAARPRKNSKTDNIIDIAVKHPDLSLSEIGKLAECSKNNVWLTLKRYGIIQEDVKEYQDNQKAYWDAATQKSLRTYLKLDEAESKSLLLRRGLVDAGIATDKSLQLSGGINRDAQPMVVINMIAQEIPKNQVCNIIEINDTSPQREYNALPPGTNDPDTPTIDI